MALVAGRFSSALPWATRDRLEKALVNDPPIRSGELNRSAVVAIQQALVDLDDTTLAPAGSVVDGYFGPATASWVRNFQTKYGLVADGVIGRDTMSALDHIFASGAVGCTRGYSLHFGCDQVDPASYQPSPIKLPGAAIDASDYEAICSSLGFRARSYIGKAATSQALFAELASFANSMQCGDTLVITYAGHGTQIPNIGPETEDDGMDEALVMYDRLVCDDELFLAFRSFAKGTRIFFVSDSCHSGTVVRDGLLLGFDEPWGDPLQKRLDPQTQKVIYTATYDGVEQILGEDPLIGECRNRGWDPQIAAQVYSRQAGQALLQLVTSTPFREPNASVLLLAACQDNQVAADYGSNGAFTFYLKQVWAGGAFEGTWADLCADITANLPPSQTPNLLAYGPSSLSMQCERPFHT